MNRALSQSIVWLSADQATQHLALKSRRALYQAVRRGVVPVHRLGRRLLRFDKAELDRVIARPK